jgi:hypothetical protein
VDKIIESQTTSSDNREWFEALRVEHDIPPVYGSNDWVEDVLRFAGMRQRPILTYFEEMAVSTYRDEWHVYKDEWCPNLLDSRRSWPRGYDVFRRGGEIAANYRVNFSKSYRDYAAWYANEWLKRGVGLYWDNTFLTTSDNLSMTEAVPKGLPSRMKPRHLDCLVKATRTVIHRTGRELPLARQGDGCAGRAGGRFLCDGKARQQAGNDAASHRH